MPTHRVRVVGRVQGVGFRWWTRSLAQRLGVTGSVRNLEDGSVEVIATGSSEQLAALDEQLGQGPPGAHVDHLSSTPIDPRQDSDFRIAH